MKSGHPGTNRLQTVFVFCKFVIRAIIATLAIFRVLSSTAAAEVLPLSDFFKLATPGHLSLTVFTTGYGSDAYAKTDEGFEFEQSVTRYVGLVGRASSYQVYYGDGYDTPFIGPKAGVRNFGRLEGGIDLIPFQGTSLIVFGGEDVGSSHGPVVDGRFSSWILFHSLHPINLSFDAAHYYHNGLSGGRITCA
jgi:hypothetical protein